MELTTAIVGLSILLQTITAVQALRLVKTTGHAVAWVLIAIAISDCVLLRRPPHGFTLTPGVVVRGPPPMPRDLIPSTRRTGMTRRTPSPKKTRSSHEVLFDASDLPSGTYLYRLETPQGSFVRTMLPAK